MRVGLKQRENLHAAGQAFQQALKAHKAIIRVGRFGQSAKDLRLQAGKDFAAAGGAGGAQAASVPATNKRRDIARPLKAHGAQSLECFGVIISAGKDEIASIGRQAFGLLEKQAVFLRHILQILHQRGFKISRGFISGKPREAVKIVALLRLGLGLFVEAHLQPVFHAAQEIIRRPQAAGRVLVNPVFLGQHVEHVDGAVTA